MTELLYDMHTPLTEHRGLAAVMYGRDFLDAVDGPVLNVAAGHTDLAGDLRDRGMHAQVVSLDPVYETNGLYNGTYHAQPDRVPGVAEDIPYPDNTFATTLCQFGAQHFADQKKALSEMVRVTKPADSLDDRTKGTILVNPIWHSRRLAAALWDNGFQDVCGIQDPAEHVRGRDALPTLVIKKVPALDEARLDALLAVVADAGSLNPRKEVGERLARLFGHSRR